MAVASLAPTTLSEVSPDASYSADDTGAWVDATVDTLNSEDDGEFIYAKLGTSSGWSTRHWFAAYELAAAPLLSVVKSVTARVVLDSYSANDVAVDLVLELFLIIGGVRYLSDPIAVSGSTPTTERQFREFDAVWSVNPATGLAFTSADLAAGAITAGFRFRCATDPFGAAINLTETGACCQVFELEVQGPSTASVEVVRHVLSSHQLRHLDEGEPITIEVAWQYGDVGILKPIWLASPDLPTADGLGSGPQTTRRRAVLVLSKTALLLKKRWRLKLLDLRPFSCSYYSPEVTAITADAQDNGVARLDMGGGWFTEREQAGYAARPPDGRWISRAPNTPRYHKDYGLLICGGGQRWTANNTFSQGFGGDILLGLGLGTGYTGWSFVPNVALPWDVASSEAHRTEELFELLFDVEGIRRSVKLHDGYRSGHADAPIYAVRTPWAVGANAKVRGFMKYFSDYASPFSPSSAPRWMLVRNGSDYFVPGSGWVGSPTWNLPDQNGVAGAGPGVLLPFEEFWTEEIDVGASPCTLEWRCGYSTHVSGAGVFPFQNTFVFAAAGLVESNGNAHCFQREFLVTTTADLEQEADDIDLFNDADNRVWDVDRGTVHFEFTPDWRHADLADGDIKYLIAGVHGFSADGGARYDNVFYQRTDATSGRYVFQRMNAAGDQFEAVFDVSGDALPAWRTTVKVGLLWTSELGELGLPPNTHQILIDREEGVAAQVTGTLPTQVDGETRVYRGRAPGCTNDEYADGYFRHFRARIETLSVVELQRALDY